MKCCNVIFIIGFFFLLKSCSKDDLGDGSIASETFIDLVVVSENEQFIFQTNIFNNANSVFDFNLTQELNLLDEEYLLNTHNNLISLISRAGLNYRVSQKNFESSEILLLSYICNLDSNEIGIRTAISNNRVSMITLTDLGSEGFFKLKSYNIKTQTCEELFLGNDELVGKTLIDGENLFITQVENGNIYKIKKIDLGSMEVSHEILFDEVFKSTIHEGQLYVFFPDNTYTIYATDTFNIVSNANLEFGLLPISLGLFESNIFENLLEINIPYIQPSNVEFAPGIVNLDTGNVVNGGDYFALSLRERLSDLYSATVTLTTYTQNLKESVIAYGFEVGNNGNIGGIVYTNYEGEINKIVDLDYVPNTIILR